MHNKLIFFAVFMASSKRFSEAQNCSISCLCLGTTLATDAGTDLAGCVDRCQTTAGCEYYTYDYEDTFCGAYSNCDTVDEDCTSCVSGENECPPLLCGTNGGCIGTLINELNILGTDQTCGDLCQQDADCAYYTYYPDQGNCLLYGTCRFDSATCQGCQTSERDCDGDDSPGTNERHILLAITAFTHDRITVIDLNNPASDCNNLGLGPLTNAAIPQSMQASYVDNHLMVCAYNALSCYYYDDKTLQWNEHGPYRLVDRFLPFGLDINGSYFWVSGGDYLGYLDSTEEYEGREFNYGIDLPIAVSDHCAVHIEGDQVMIVGGYGNSNGEAFIINISTGEWQSVPFPLIGELILPQCGLATLSDGSKQVVVAGGGYLSNEAIDNTYVYDLNQGVFLPGPFLPETRMFGRAVQYQNSFVIVGGSENGSDGVMREDILFYNPDDGVWEVLPQRLENPDYVTAALLVDDDFNVTC